jgi:hypothetical protein
MQTQSQNVLDIVTVTMGHSNINCLSDINLLTGHDVVVLHYFNGYDVPLRPQYFNANIFLCSDIISLFVSFMSRTSKSFCCTLSSRVIPWRLNFICRRFGTPCLFHLHRRRCMKNLHTYPSAYKVQTSGNYPEESVKHSEHGERLKSRTILFAADIKRHNSCPI